MIAEYEVSEMYNGYYEKDAIWYSLYQMLRKPVRHWVYTHKVPSWIGQEDDIIEDIIQETVLRTWRYCHEREQKQTTSVNSLPQFSKTVACNYYKDLRRRDCHLIPTKSLQLEYILVLEMAEDPQNIVTEHVWQNELFVSIANTIAKFPTKQRKALLTDLACRMDFHGPPTPLQRAFLHEGIRLEEFQHLPSKDAGERNRYLSALSTAYKRLRSIMVPDKAGSVPNQKTKRQPEPLKEDIHNDPDKVSTQISMFLLVPSSLEVEKIASQVMGLQGQ